MPELPEVETVKNILTREIVGKTVETVDLYYPKMVKTQKIKLDQLIGHRFEEIHRKGKFLIFDLSGELTMILHLRMEGKFFVLPARPEPRPKSLSFALRLDSGEALCFFDTRKFGVVYLFEQLSSLDIEPLNSVGPDPFECDADYLYEKYHRQKRYLKEVLLDQSLVSGIGNIYADEILFASNLSPFMSAARLDPEGAKRIHCSAQAILKKSIEVGGSTVKSYLSSPDHAGGFQSFLKVYGRSGKKCLVCGTRIEKRKLNGRGTSFCRHCQHQGVVVGLTGLIGAGKSTVAKIFVEKGFHLYDCDARVHQLYTEPDFLSRASKEFPALFSEGYDRGRLLKNLLENPALRRKYETYLYRSLRLDVVEYLNSHAEQNVIIEAPRLFEAGFDSFCSYLVGITAPEKQVIERLKSRGVADIDRMLELNANSRLLKKMTKLDFVIDNSSTIEDLKEKTSGIIAAITEE